MHTFNTRRLSGTALLAAVSTVLMFFSFSVPLMPPFIKMDFSELPALIAAFSMGPLSGVLVCLVKNLINLLFTTTGGVGELCNFLLGATFVLPAGLLYRLRRTRKGALLGALFGALVSAGLSVAVNGFLVYPFYAQFMMPMETILSLYQKINPSIQNLWQALTCFNLPFTLIKWLLDVFLTFILYKHVSRWMHSFGAK